MATNDGTVIRKELVSTYMPLQSFCGKTQLEVGEVGLSGKDFLP